ncbi:unnamed protein product [Microthlaspi erraticum]|uniref:Uncharacterized protein n=1 Tax=Microthlaspi erraticum TaxID=1685480 RepID=A0A6D2IJK2_9BRAS|nr:unnamed protein product [Microthlaspi erraticum]
MNTKNNVVEDVSPFFVFESSADSETHEERRQHGNANDDKGYGDYGNDAESTSQRTIGATGYDSVEMDEEEEVVVGEKEEHDDVEVNSYRRKESENLTVDRSSTGNDEKLIREMEKSRMFWEACLSS